jgi:hypothetical protein
MRTAQQVTITAMLALAPMLAACGQQSTTTASASAASVSGTLVQVGGMAPGSPVPLPGKIQARSASGAVFEVTAGKDGKFRLSLPAGTYQLAGYSPLMGTGKVPCPEPRGRTLTVAAGHPQQGIRLACSIR